jgi:putative transposase
VSRFRTYKFLLEPTSRQLAALECLRELQRELYNAALEERRGSWKWNQHSVSFFDQTKELTQLRSVRPDTLAFGVTVCRGTLKRLDRAFQGFFRRCKAEEKPGFPRFKGPGSFVSLQWGDRNGWAFDEDAKRLRLYGIGHVKVRLHRPIKGTPKTITIRREGKRYWVSIQCADVPAEPFPKTGKSIGIDLGVDFLVATSDGALVQGPRFGKQGQAGLEKAQRDLATKVSGSKNREKAKQRVSAHHRRIGNRRREFAHQVSRRLVNDHDLIVYEDLKIKNMTRRPKPRPDQQGGYEPNRAQAKAGLNRSIHDAGWGQFVAMTIYKAESAGREVIAVDPRNTSRTCPGCGHVSAGNRCGAVFRCQSCGHEAHADVNAAENILRAGRARQLIAA